MEYAPTADAAPTNPAKPRKRKMCRHCRELRQVYRRGLCLPCYHRPEVRKQYGPSSSKGNKVDWFDTEEGEDVAIPSIPTNANPGSEDKIAIMAERVSHRMAVAHPLDAYGDPELEHESRKQKRQEYIDWWFQKHSGCCLILLMNGDCSHRNPALRKTAAVAKPQPRLRRPCRRRFHGLPLFAAWEPSADSPAASAPTRRIALRSADVRQSPGKPSASPGSESPDVKPKRKVTSYTAAQQTAALDAIAANGWSWLEARRQLGINEVTLRGWAKRRIAAASRGSTHDDVRTSGQLLASAFFTLGNLAKLTGVPMWKMRRLYDAGRFLVRTVRVGEVRAFYFEDREKVIAKAMELAQTKTQGAGIHSTRHANHDVATTALPIA